MFILRKSCFVFIALALSAACFAADMQVTVATAPAQDNRTNLEKLKDPDAMVRRNAVIYVGAEKKKENIPALIEMLNDPSTQVERSAINALASAGDADSVVKPLVDKFAAEKNVSIRMNIIVALGDLKAKAAIPVIIAQLKDSYPAMRNEAIRALGKINDKSTYANITAMLKDQAEGTKIMAADVSGTLKLKSANAQLIANLKDPVAQVRKASITALGNIGSEASQPEIAKMLNDKDASVAAAAKQALASLEANQPTNKGNK